MTTLPLHTDVTADSKTLTNDTEERTQPRHYVILDTVTTRKHKIELTNTTSRGRTVAETLSL